MRLTRGQKTVRNLGLCVLLATLAYAALGFPPYTVRGMLERTERHYLLSGLEPVLVDRDSWRFSDDWFSRHSTLLLARTGDSYVAAEFQRHFLEVYSDRGRSLKMRQGAVCAAHSGTLFVAGDFGAAVSATAEVTVEGVIQIIDQDTGEFQSTFREPETFSYQGEKAGDGAFSFRYGDKEKLRHTDEGLAGAAYNRYRAYAKGDMDGGYSILHADLPVRVTLYGEGGEVLKTLELSVDNYELFSRW